MTRIYLLILTLFVFVSHGSLYTWSYGPKFYTSALHDVTEHAGFDQINGFVVATGDFNSDKLYPALCLIILVMISLF